MQRYILILVSALALVLSACGGGGSSSGGGVGGSGGAVSSSSTLSGVQNVTLSSSGVTSTDQVIILIDVSGSSVVIRDPDFTISTTLDANNRFSGTSPTITLNIGGGVTCTGRLTYNGSISGNTASGNLSGFFDCPGVPRIRVTGTFSAIQGSAKQLRKTLADAIRENTF